MPTARTTRIHSVGAHPLPQFLVRLDDHLGPLTRADIPYLRPHETDAGLRGQGVKGLPFLLDRPEVPVIDADAAWGRRAFSSRACFKAVGQQTREQ